MQHKFIILLNSGKSTLVPRLPTPVDIPGILNRSHWSWSKLNSNSCLCFWQVQSPLSCRTQGSDPLFPYSITTFDLLQQKCICSVFALYLSHPYTSIHCHKHRAEAKKCIIYLYIFYTIFFLISPSIGIWYLNHLSSTFNDLKTWCWIWPALLFWRVVLDAYIMSYTLRYYI